MKVRPDYSRANAKRGIRNDIVVIAAIILVPAIWLVGREVYSRGKERERVFQSNIAFCRSNITELYGILKAYTSSHGGQFPDSLQELIASGVLTDTHLLLCPNSSDVAAEGATTQSLVQDAQKPGRVSYIYAGKGLTENSPAESVLLFEPAGNHPGAGGHVLQVDGRVRFLPPAELKALTARVGASRGE